MNTFSTRESIHYGWETFKKRPWFFVGATLVFMLVSALSSSIPLISIVAGMLLKMGTIAFSLKAYESLESVKIEDLWAPHPFWKFTFTSIVVGVLIVIGLIFLIVPGFILAIRYFFVQYLVMDRNMGVSEAMAESARITRGHRWKLFVFLLAIVGVNILGVLCLVVGLFVSIPVTLMAVAHAYRTLEHRASEIAPAPASA